MVECMVRMKIENRNTTPFLPFKDPRLEMDCCDEIVRFYPVRLIWIFSGSRCFVVVVVTRLEKRRNDHTPSVLSMHKYRNGRMNE